MRETRVIPVAASVYLRVWQPIPLHPYPTQRMTPGMKSTSWSKGLPNWRSPTFRRASSMPKSCSGSSRPWERKGERFGRGARKASRARNARSIPRTPGWPAREEPQPRHAEVIASVLKSGQSRLLAPTSSRRPMTPPGTQPDPSWSFRLGPSTARRMGVIEIFQRSGVSPRTQQGYLAFLDAIGDLIGDYCRNCLFRDFRLRAGDWTRLAQFVRRLHGSLDLSVTAYAIANDGRSLLGCDRVTVLVGRGGRFRRLPSAESRLSAAAQASCGDWSNCRPPWRKPAKPFGIRMPKTICRRRSSSRWRNTWMNRIAAGWPCCRCHQSTKRRRTAGDRSVSWSWSDSRESWIGVGGGCCRRCASIATLALRNARNWSRFRLRVC